jgi:hypothetical protein
MRSLHKKKVSAKAKQLTHEICGQLRSVLDRIARRYWNIHVAPQLSAEDQKIADVYFPIAPHLEGVDSTLGRWRWKFVRAKHQAVYDYLVAQQAFSDPKNKWIAIVGDLAIQGKHIDLVPQKRTEQRVTKVEKAGVGSVSWGQGQSGGFIGFGPGGSIGFGPGGVIGFGPQGVSFRGNVSAMGVPIDPQTQRVVPSSDVTERIETWVSFTIDGHGVNAAVFCKQACHETRRIVQEMTDQFGLS